jgi:hypothetical protein
MGLLSMLRGFADISGGKWVELVRHSTWIPIGDLNLGAPYVSVSYSKESALKLGNMGAFCVLKSEDFAKLKVFYFGVSINVEKKVVRVMRLRTENMANKFLDEKIFQAHECINIPFSQNVNLDSHLEQMERYASANGYYSVNDGSWYDELCRSAGI